MMWMARNIKHELLKVLRLHIHSCSQKPGKDKSEVAKTTARKKAQSISGRNLAERCMKYRHKYKQQFHVWTVLSMESLN